MLDDLVNPYLHRRQALGLIRHARRALALALIVVVAVNLSLLLGPAVPGHAPSLDAGVRISLGLCLATALCGSFLGLFLACVPWVRLPYLYKLPVAALAGMVLLQAVVALGQGLPWLFGLLASLH